MPRQPESPWCIGLGRWGGVSVRVHVTLLISIIGLLAVTIPSRLELGLTLLGVYLASLLMHELAHLVCAWQLGGHCEQVVMGPAGGMVPHEVAEEPEPQLLLALAGPILHLSMVVAAVGSLVYLNDPQILTLLCPVMPTGLLEATGDLPLLLLKSTLWVNMTLLVLNSLPVWPFDAAIATRAVLWPMTGLRTSYMAVGRIAMGMGILLLLSGGALWIAQPPQQLVSGILCISGLYVAVAARRDLWQFDRDEADRDNELSRLDDRLSDDEWFEDDPSHMVLVEQHYDQLRERYERQRKAREDYEDARVDDILARLHHDGYEHLSAEDQAFLRRASQRYRDRRQRENR
jgi:stage IV sporulation protein FB